MPCNCKKRAIKTQPKKIQKAPPRKPDGSGGPHKTSTIRRVIRRAGK